jgi:hypothetical protein
VNYYSTTDWYTCQDAVRPNTLRLRLKEFLTIGIHIFFVAARKMPECKTLEKENRVATELYLFPKEKENIDKTSKKLRHCHYNQIRIGSRLCEGKVLTPLTSVVPNGNHSNNHGRIQFMIKSLSLLFNPMYVLSYMAFY